MQYDYSKLLGRMRELGKTQELLARGIGINPATLNLKLNNKSEWTQDQIAAACASLRINSQEIPMYFFSSDITKT